MYDPATGTYEGSWSTGALDPWGIAVSGGNVYVAESNPNGLDSEPKPRLRRNVTGGQGVGPPTCPVMHVIGQERGLGASGSR